MVNQAVAADVQAVLNPADATSSIYLFLKLKILLCKKSFHYYMKGFFLLV